MNFSQRLSRFLIGLVAGCILSWYFFSGRGCTGWLPKEQILGRLNSKMIDYSERSMCRLKCDSISVEEANAILSGGNVVLPKSDTKGLIKRYRIEELGKEMRRAFILVQEQDSLVTVIDAGRVEGSLDCACPPLK